LFRLSASVFHSNYHAKTKVYRRFWRSDTISEVSVGERRFRVFSGSDRWAGLRLPSHPVEARLSLAPTSLTRCTSCRTSMRQPQPPGAQAARRLRVRLLWSWERVEANILSVSVLRRRAHRRPIECAAAGYCDRTPFFHISRDPSSER